MRSLFYRSYLPKGIDLKDPTVSPHFADPQPFPEIITFVTCGGDKLSTEAIQMADNLQAAGKQVVKYSAVGQGELFYS